MCVCVNEVDEIIYIYNIYRHMYDPHKKKTHIPGCLLATANPPKPLTATPLPDEKEDDGLLNGSVGIKIKTIVIITLILIIIMII